MFALLLVLIAAVAAQPVQRPQLPKFPFLNQVSVAAQQEFQNIFRTHELTRPQFEEKIMRWAEKHNIKKSVLSFKEKLEKDKRTAEAELQQTLTKLPQFFRDYKQIAEDTKLTWKQAEERRDHLIKKLTPKQQQAAAILIELFAPKDEAEAKQKQNGPGAGGQYPPRQYGPEAGVQYPPGQYGPGVSGQYSPGQYGPQQFYGDGQY